MITTFTGEFLLHPIPFEMSQNLCSHKCVYCFAGVREKPNKFNLSGFLKQKENFQKRKDSWTFRKLREGYPIALSNNTDPFSDNNAPFTETVLEYFKRNNIRVFFQTKGGKRALELIKAYGIPSCVYVTITTENEEISKRIEPNAPTPNERIELIQNLIALGHKVIVGINPLNVNWMAEEETLNLMNKLDNIGVYSYMFQPLFIRKKRVQIYESRDFAGVDLTSKEEYKDLLDFIKTILRIENETKYRYQTLYHPFKTNAFDVVKEVYNGKSLPIIYDFLNQIWDKPKGQQNFNLEEFTLWFTNAYRDFFEDGKGINLLSYLFVQSNNEYKKHCKESAKDINRMAKWYYDFIFKRFGYLEYNKEENNYKIKGVLKLKTTE